MYTKPRNFTQIMPSSSSSFESPVTSTENSPKIPLSSVLNDSSNFSNNSSTTQPSSNHQKYKDLLIFEERLKQNLHQLQRRSYKYEGDCFHLTVFIFT